MHTNVSSGSAATPWGHKLLTHRVTGISAKIGNLNFGLSLEATSLFLNNNKKTRILPVFKAGILQRNYFSWTLDGMWKPIFLIFFEKPH